MLWPWPNNKAQCYASTLRKTKGSSSSFATSTCLASFPSYLSLLFVCTAFLFYPFVSLSSPSFAHLHDNQIRSLSTTKMDSKSSETRLENLTYELRTLNIPFKTAADSDWSSWAKTYNVRIPVTPAVVVCPVFTIQIGVAVKLARRYGLKVQARSGGHSYASHSNGGVDGAMVIDLRKLNIVLCRPPSAFVYGGARLGEMAQTIYRKSGHALPHGTCADVGVGGHFTHGGFGFFSRAWGLAMDRITGLGVVTADGEDRHVSETKFPDLYYVSCRYPSRAEWFR